MAKLMFTLTINDGVNPDREVTDTVVLDKEFNDDDVIGAFLEKGLIEPEHMDSTISVQLH